MKQTFRSVSISNTMLRTNEDAPDVREQIKHVVTIQQIETNDDAPCYGPTRMHQISNQRWHFAVCRLAQCSGFNERRSVCKKANECGLDEVVVFCWKQMHGYEASSRFRDMNEGSNQQGPRKSVYLCYSNQIICSDFLN
eukprot:Gb_27453 [translate_table: standard]